jgi:surface antigen
MSRLATGCLSLLLLAGCAAGPRVVDLIVPSDLALVAAVTQSALESNKVGQSANWSNPADGHLGTVTPYSTFPDSKGAPCRHYQQTITIDGRTAFAYDIACRNAAGQWISMNFDSLAAAIRNGTSSPDTYPYYERYPYYGYDPYCYGGFGDPFCYPYGGSLFVIEREHHHH